MKFAGYLREYLHINFQSLAQIRNTIGEIQRFFLGGVFFIGAPCSYYNNSSRPTASDVNKATSINAKTTTVKAKTKATITEARPRLQTPSQGHSHMLPRNCQCQTTHNG